LCHHNYCHLISWRNCCNIKIKLCLNASEFTWNRLRHGVPGDRCVRRFGPTVVLYETKIPHLRKRRIKSKNVFLNLENRCCQCSDGNRASSPEGLWGLTTHYTIEMLSIWRSHWEEQGFSLRQHVQVGYGRNRLSNRYRGSSARSKDSGAWSWPQPAHVYKADTWHGP
jgi:hypothetical protein